MTNPQAISWTAEEFEKLVNLVKPRKLLHHVQEEPSRNNILARDAAWHLISKQLGKPVEDCRKRWKALRDCFVRTQRLGNQDRIKSSLFAKLDFLNDNEDTAKPVNTPNSDPTAAKLEAESEAEPEAEAEEEMEIEALEEINETEKEGEMERDEKEGEQVIMDNQEYYEITLVDPPQYKPTLLPIDLIAPLDNENPPKKRGRRGNGGRKKCQPPPPLLHPVKILPKPLVMNNAKIMYVNDKAKAPPSHMSEVLESLVEKLLKENTNEIDVFFKSMASSVKKLPPNLIPKVKMEVCNVIAKYEMQSLQATDKHSSS